MSNQISVIEYRDAFMAAACYLDQQKEFINELNVFPVPDGDTGTNMTMTIMTAAREVASIDNPTLDNVSKAMASGSLRGARGNSGVILSQLIRGFTKEIRESESIDCLTLARAFTRAVDTAYKAVMKPKEGTILTVAHEMADRIAELSVSCEDPIEMLEEVLKCGDLALERTPELLPVLKEAGVVDSGGQGLMAVLKGALASLKGQAVVFDGIKYGKGEGNEVLTTGISSVELSDDIRLSASIKDISTSDIKFVYCTEFMINGEKEFEDAEVEELRAYLSGIGDSLVCFSDENIIKVHVHTNHPGDAFEKGLTMGYLSKMKIDNMRIEHNEVLIRDASRIASGEKPDNNTINPHSSQVSGKDLKSFASDEEFGFVAVCAGEGLKSIFQGLGVDYVLSGGQTMNPSTEDFIRAINEVDARNIFLLPNNKNIILAAKQAVSLVRDRSVYLIPSAAIPQGISAMIAFRPDLSPEENEKGMNEALSTVSCAEVTSAVRDSLIEGQEIHQGDRICIGDGGLLSVGKSVEEAVILAFRKMMNPESEIMTLYFGDDINYEDAKILSETLCKEYPDAEVELESGGQPVYSYILSVE